MRSLAGLIFLASSLGARFVYGESAAGSGSARTHFNDGVAHAARGDVAVALQEFEAAYALKPHYSVLYNIGQAHAALGHPKEAIEAFERHLLEGGNRISQGRRDQVRELIAQSRAKLGAVRLVGVTGTTRVWLDGIEVERQALRDPLLISPGRHAFLSSHAGEAPSAQAVLIVAATTTELALPALPSSIPEASAPAQLRVVCNLAGVAVEVDGTMRGTTPVPTPLPVPAGPHQVRFSRAGYRPVMHRVLAGSAEPAAVLCDQAMEPVLEPAERGQLVLQLIPADASAFVDGQRFLGAPLPYGPHELRVERDGFVGQTRAIVIRPRDVTTYRVTLAATASRQASERRERARRSLLGYTIGGGGLAFAISGGGLLAWNGGRYDAWSRHRNASGASQLQTVASIQRVDDIGFGFVGLGVGLIAASAWLLFSAPTENE